MALPAKAKMLKQLSKVYLVRDTPSGGGSTTLAAAVNVGDGTVSITGNTNFASGDIVRIGAGEEMELAKINGALTGAGPFTATLLNLATKAHIAGEDFVEQTVYDLGAVDDQGTEIHLKGQTQDLAAATQRLVYNTLVGYVSGEGSFALPGMSLFNWIVALGMPLSMVTGTGAPASPFHLVTAGDEIGSLTNASLISISVLGDGTFLREELWGIDVDYTGFAVALKRGTAAPVPVKVVAAAGGVADTNADPYLPVTTNTPGKGKVWDFPAEVGVFTDSGVTNSLNGAVAPGAAALVLASATGFTVGSWVRVGTGSTVEFHLIDNIASNTLNLRTKVLRAIATATVVTQQTLSPFGGIHEDGVGISVNGNVDPIRVATKRFQAGLRMGAAAFQGAWKVVDLSLSNLARALGIPQSAIASGRLPLNNNIGTTTVDGVYVRGFLQDGSTWQMNFWGVATDMTDVFTKFSQQGIASIPMSFKPTSGIQLLQWL